MTADSTRQPAVYSLELRTGRWYAMVQWYRTALGLRVLFRVQDDEFAMLDMGRTLLSLISDPDCEPASNRLTIVFEVADLDAAAQQLSAAAAPIERRGKHVEGYEELVTADPDGNRIRLIAWPQ